MTDIASITAAEIAAHRYIVSRAKAKGVPDGYAYKDVSEAFAAGASWQEGLMAGSGSYLTILAKIEELAKAVALMASRIPETAIPFARREPETAVDYVRRIGDEARKRDLSRLSDEDLRREYVGMRIGATEYEAEKKRRQEERNGGRYFASYTDGELLSARAHVSANEAAALEKEIEGRGIDGPRTVEHHPV